MKKKTKQESKKKKWLLETLRTKRCKNAKMTKIRKTMSLKERTRLVTKAEKRTNKMVKMRKKKMIPTKYLLIGMKSSKMMWKMPNLRLMKTSHKKMKTSRIQKRRNLKSKTKRCWNKMVSRIKEIEICQMMMKRKRMN